MPEQSELEVGDTFSVVITQTNEDRDRDPVAQVDGVTTFVRFPDNETPEFGETVSVKLADKGDSHMVAVAHKRG